MAHVLSIFSPVSPDSQSSSLVTDERAHWELTVSSHWEPTEFPESKVEIWEWHAGDVLRDC